MVGENYKFILGLHTSIDPQNCCHMRNFLIFPLFSQAFCHFQFIAFLHNNPESLKKRGSNALSYMDNSKMTNQK